MKINFHIHQMPLHKQAHTYKYIILLTFHPISFYVLCFGLSSSLDAALGLCSQKFSLLKAFLSKDKKKPLGIFPQLLFFVSMCQRQEILSKREDSKQGKRTPFYSVSIFLTPTPINGKEYKDQRINEEKCFGTLVITVYCHQWPMTMIFSIKL